MQEEIFRLVSLRPNVYGTWRELCNAAGVTAFEHVLCRYSPLPTLRAVVDSFGIPVWAPTLFLARCAITSRGVTDDTARTYGESLLSWLRYVSAVGLTLDEASEELLQLFRAELCHSRGYGRNSTSTATANLRVAVVIQFHKWCQNNGYPSPLGAYLLSPNACGRRLSPRVVRRHPRLLGPDELRGLFSLVRHPYKLAFRWALVTGLRRFELAILRCSALPRPETLPFQEDGLAKVQISRKGGRELTVYVPTSLIEETQWYVITDRYEPDPGFEDYVFLGQNGRPLSRRSLSGEFRRCATLIGTDATLHHLRHTYAVNVLRFLDRISVGQIGEARNSLKTLQVLMGHAHSETTELYLRAMDVTNNAVVSALEYLYGASA
ncbi:Tyrosine recombinase XerC [Burkholderia aenigmatica]|uniref:Tyrosine recombinase XerC n=1 Tax=Burkholderia aenigmatica TaxID=2015348 RepID=A0A6P2RU53_9BURK|nr:MULTISPECIES: tyrosine-type recombinase/integrase [Burkholderia]VWC37119.1 Tyrosine recombinase XerC [Burkholderia aenigmatica]